VWRYFDWRAAWSLLSFGALVVLAQAADFLYAPTDYILINRLLDPEDVAAYAPAVQIDGGLLLLVTGLAAVLFPHAAVAHAGGDRAAVLAYYVRGTRASVGLLTVAALAVWAVSPWLFRIWLGQPMLATQAILPLVLVHTVIGGSAAVGRSVLLGMGKVGPFTAAVLVSGVANVGLSYCFVNFGGMGLNGIVLGTIIAAVGRAGVWMPWYTLRAIRRMEGPLRPEPAEAAIAPV
jgi:O-antigen/teichoic acid export membrane protein